MNVADSSCWVEYFTGGPNAAAFTPLIEDTSQLIVPTVVLMEVFKHILRWRGIQTARQTANLMSRGQIVDLDAPLAFLAAQIANETKLPLADSIILATAQRFGATLWTQDSHFEGVDKVKYIPAQRAGK